MHRLNKMIWYTVSAPFIHKLGYMWKSDEEIKRLNEQSTAVVKVQLDLLVDGKGYFARRKQRKALLATVGKKCCNVTDAYLGIRLHDFFNNFPPNNMEYLRNWMSNHHLSVILKGNLAEKVLESFDDGKVYDAIPGMLIKKARYSEHDVSKIYTNFIWSQYRSGRRKLGFEHEVCPHCKSSSFYRMEHNGECDECETFIEPFECDLVELKEDETEEQYKALLKHHLDTGDDMFDGRLVSS